MSIDGLDDWDDVWTSLLHVCVSCGEFVIGWCDHGGLLCDECCAGMIRCGLHAALPGYTADPRWYLA